MEWLDSISNRTFGNIQVIDIYILYQRCKFFFILDSRAASSQAIDTLSYFTPTTYNIGRASQTAQILMKFTKYWKEYMTTHQHPRARRTSSGQGGRPEEAKTKNLACC
jgi:hypothetical protein